MTERAVPIPEICILELVVDFGFYNQHSSAPYAQMSISERNGDVDRRLSVGQGLGVGEITIDLPGEGDGCDRCGCPDEEVSS